ncbi:MAG TPA: DNA polymerase IV [Myxococcota bacterium]|nr:DNA polymerase IV [Myxococcota bacterium]
MQRVILHVDMDAFFAAIEQRDRPELRGQPVIVGGSRTRGVVSTCSYEARRYGVHSAMPMSRAVRHCPRAVVLPVRMEAYCEASAQLMEVLDAFSPRVEPLSLDEAFLDMTGAEGLFGPPEQMARAIQARIRERTRLGASVGIASNKFLAKLASDLEKPNGCTWVPFGREREFIAPLPVRRLWGVGPRAAELLAGLGLATIGDVAACEPGRLRRELGAFGEHIHALSQGLDDRPVVSAHDRKSVGSERTLERDIRGRGPVEKHLRAACERVARDLRAAELLARAVRVKLKYATFQLATRDGPLPAPADDSAALYEGARGLLERLDLEAPIRLVGAAAFDLLPRGQPVQGDLFLQPVRQKHHRLESTLDAIREKFGDKIRRAGDGED